MHGIKIGNGLTAIAHPTARMDFDHQLKIIHRNSLLILHNEFETRHIILAFEMMSLSVQAEYRIVGGSLENIAGIADK